MNNDAECEIILLDDDNEIPASTAAAADLIDAKPKHDDKAKSEGKKRKPRIKKLI